MKRGNLVWAALAAAAVVATAVAVPAGADKSAGETVDRADAAAPTVRFATFNASLNREAPGQLVRDLSTTDNPQARKAAEVLQRVRPDVVLINEFDYVLKNKAADLFRKNYLEVGQKGAKPIRYRYAYTAPVNTGVPTGFDLDRDGSTTGPGDAHGFGDFKGQYGMLVLSRYPIDAAKARTFQKFLWKDMPGAVLPDDPETDAPADWYSAEQLDVLRLSSKSHWDLPIKVGKSTVHFLVSHPTPPVFDGPEDRNGTRNHDEIRFWADYLTPGKDGYIYDDKGRRGGLKPGSWFVVAGDLNADPLDGDSVEAAVRQVLDAPRVQDPKPTSEGGVVAAEEQGGINAEHRGDPALDTGDFDDTSPGNLRSDYVLPSRGLPVRGAGVFWPTPQEELSRLNDTSDHHLVWVDVKRR